MERRPSDRACGSLIALEDILCDLERAVSGRDAGVNRYMKEGLSDLVRIDPHVPAGSKMHLEFADAPEGGEDGDRDEAAGAPVHVRSRPHRPPRRLGDEGLERGVEVGCPCCGGVDMRVAEPLPTRLRADLELVAHQSSVSKVGPSYRGPGGRARY